MARWSPLGVKFKISLKHPCLWHMGVPPPGYMHIFKSYIDNNKWVRIVLEYLFESSTWYLTSKCNKGVRFKVEHSKRYSISTINYILFCLLHRHTDSDILDDFTKIIFWRLSKTCPKWWYECCQTFSENFQRLLKIFQGNRRLPKTFEDNPKMFQSYTNKFKYNLRVKFDISEIIDIFTSEDMKNVLPESWLWFCMTFMSGLFSIETLMCIW